VQPQHFTRGTFRRIFRKRDGRSPGKLHDGTDGRSRLGRILGNQETGTTQRQLGGENRKRGNWAKFSLNAVLSGQQSGKGQNLSATRTTNR